ncbi:protein timeless isoform X2 [Bemisia tabaci]|uniref:protein timeless isoform X2 n=1 Tax=Bemisia tabaci TaxID=7038 RepID=UPI003B2826CB
MEWVVVNSQVHLQSVIAALGTQIGDSYVVGETCLENLHLIYRNLCMEDRTSRSFRRSIGHAQAIKKDLLPLLTNSKDKEILALTIKILVNLTLPVECLLCPATMTKSPAGSTVVYELNWLLHAAKESFVDKHSTRSVVDFMQEILEKVPQLDKMECEHINTCLLLLRNILHIPETRGVFSLSLQNQIIWNLFTQNIDKVLIQLMNEDLCANWGITIAQLIALIYKDQHVNTLQKLLSLWFEAALSDSSDDNESNTSPPERNNDSFSNTTSDPTSDSSETGSDNVNQSSTQPPKQQQPASIQPSTIKENFEKQPAPDTNMILGSADITPRIPTSSGKKVPGKKEIKEIEKDDSLSSFKCFQNRKSIKQCHSNEVSDRGYDTQVENQGSISTSSNEEEQPLRNAKPALKIQKNRFSKPQLSDKEKKELQSKKLMKRSCITLMNMKAFLHYTPKDGDISQLLKEFTIDFLLKGYGKLVSEFHSQVLLNIKHRVDTSHFVWMITYFLKFVTQLEIDYPLISSVVSFNTVSYLTFEGVTLCEELEALKVCPDNNLDSCFHRLHLVVIAISEVLQAINFYKDCAHLLEEDKKIVTHLYRRISKTDNLKGLFLLLLRLFDPKLQSKQFLSDIIVTNHLLLSFIDDSSQDGGNIDLMDHVKNFASKEVMSCYGLLLENFKDNGSTINNCIFNMMHHVAGDLDRIDVLFQPTILKTFSQIWQMAFQICDDWSDLIEYVIHKFINNPRSASLLNKKEKEEDSQTVSKQSEQNSGWSQNDSDNLQFFYVLSAECADPVGGVIQLYVKNGVINKTRTGVIQQLFDQEVINDGQFKKLMDAEPVDDNMSSELNAKIEESKGSSKPEVLDEIQVLRDHLIKENKVNEVLWIQNVLIECCYVKLCLAHNLSDNMEPIPLHFILMNQSVPLVPWTSEQEDIMLYQPFVLFLQKLGLNIPGEAGNMYARISYDWNPNILFALAKKLGPIDEKKLKFDPTLLLRHDGSKDIKDPLFDDNHFAVPCPKLAPFASDTLPKIPCSSSQVEANWMQVVQKSKSLSTFPSSGDNEDVEINSVGSESDLTQMYVSDEESAPAKLPEVLT